MKGGVYRMLTRLHIRRRGFPGNDHAMFQAFRHEDFPGRMGKDGLSGIRA